jgi:hypothetical protein
MYICIYMCTYIHAYIHRARIYTFTYHTHMRLQETVTTAKQWHRFKPDRQTDRHKTYCASIEDAVCMRQTDRQTDRQTYMQTDTRHTVRPRASIEDASRPYA